MPDAAIVPALSRALGVGAQALLDGRVAANLPDGGNTKRITLYHCPDCGKLLTATGPAEPVCCGRRLEPLRTQAADDDHRLDITDVEDEKLVSWRHPMEKEHRLPRIPWARYGCICSRDGGTLYMTDVSRPRKL